MITIDPASPHNDRTIKDECPNGHKIKMEVSSIQLIETTDTVAKSFGNDAPEVCISLFCYECEDEYHLIGTLNDGSHLGG